LFSLPFAIKLKLSNYKEETQNYTLNLYLYHLTSFISIMFDCLSKICKKILLFLGLVILSVEAYPQAIELGLPNVISFSTRDYRQESQNYSIAQDQRGYMYFGNLNGIMMFDNAEWRFVGYKGRPILAQGKDNLIYVGGYNILSTLKLENGKLKLQDIALPDGVIPNQINEVIVREDYVLFVGSNHILRYENNSIELIYSSEEEIRAFDVEEEVYVSLNGRGLFSLGEDGISPVDFNEFFKFKTIIDVFSDANKNLIIKTENEDGFYRVTKGSIKYIITQICPFIKSNGYSKGIAFDNGNILIGTIYGGLVYIDSVGNYLYSLNKRNLLLDNHITDIFIDNKSKVWITTYNGINQIEILSPYSYIDDNYGLYGVITTIVRYENTLYFGTSQGVYFSNTNLNYDYEINNFADDKKYSKIHDIKGEAQHFKIIDNNLLLATTTGIYCIKNCETNTNIIEGYFRQIEESKYNDSLIYITGESGLLLCTKNNGNLQPIGFIEELNYDVRTIVQESENILWLGSNNDGFFRLDFSGDSLLKPKIKQYNEGYGLPDEYEWADVYNTSFGLLFSTGKGVFNFDQEEFYFDVRFSSNNPQPDSFYPIVEDNEKNLWYCSTSYDGSSRVGYFYLNEEDVFSNESISIPKLIDHNIECIFHDRDNIVWLGGFEGLVRYIEHAPNGMIESSPAIIKSIEFADNSVINYDKLSIAGEDILVLNYSQNSLRINYTSLFYSSNSDIQYQTILEGFNDIWTIWSDENFKEFTNLPPGQYTFRVKARDKYGTVSQEAVINFIVKPPLYLTWWAIILYIAVLVSFFWIIYKFNEIRHAAEKNKLELLVAERTNELVRQKEQTEKLVRKLLPMKTAQEIQETGSAKSRRYDLVTVLFADIQGFTQIAKDTNPEELVNYLDRLFTSFDKIISKYNIEKIKTIGDAYMCAGGMPDKDRTNPVEVVLAALEMLEKLIILNTETNYDFKMRIGIHTGYVVAGVVGSQKLEYDIWGDTVNVANRMESHGIVGRVNVSEITFGYIKEFFDCEQRDKTQVKYKGDTTMYLVKKIKQNLSEFSSGVKPNKDFNTKLQSIRLNDLEEHMFEKLDKGLPKNLYYHNLKHTINVYYRVEMIGREEKVGEEDLLLLKTAAIFHDAGFMVSYDNNEVIGAKMAEDTLPLFKYTAKQIEIVKSIILATVMPPKPKNHLEMIMCDADLDYLGRPDFTPVSQNLFRELFERGKINTIEQWNRMQYRFIQKHRYFTATARRLRDPGKELVLKDLKKKI
jgi:adenylate cyclase